jgi:AAA domain-containing protein
VREGVPAGVNRSDVFHAIVGHYVGVGWDVDRIFDHLQEYPHGIGERYIHEDRLRQEIERSAGKYAKTELPGGSSTGWQAPPPEPEKEQPREEPDPGPELDDDLDDDDIDEEPSPRHDPNLPQLYGPHVPDDRPLKAWLIKNFMPQVGHGLMSGQYSTGKTFVFFELAGSLMTGQPFLGHTVKRQCGVLLIAAEGADEVRLRRDAMVREKCGDMTQTPFYWYEIAPPLLHKGAVKKLVAMARQAEASLQAKFGLPLGLIGIDTIAACAGYSRAGDEYDNAVGQAIMNVLKAVAQELGCFVLGIDHFGKSLEAGTRGASAKESSADVVLACLGEKQLSGAVTNTRLAVRKHRGGTQGQEYPYTLRLIELGNDEEGDPLTTRVVDWLPPGTAPAPSTPDDPWAKPKRQDQRTAALRLKRVLMTILAEQGVDLPIAPDGPVVRMVDQNLVRKAFYACTPADEGTPERKGHFRRQKFLRALDWAEDEQLIAVTEIEGVTYLRLTRPNEEEGQD